VGRHKARQQTKREQRASEQVGQQPQHISWYDEKGWHVYQGEDFAEGMKEYGLVIERATKSKP
jgi:hypothetical protein